MNNVDTKTVKCADCGKVIRTSSAYPNDDVHERKTDIADIKIVKHMILHAMKVTTRKDVPRNILLVSNDKDFKCMAEALTERGFKVIAAVGDEYNVKGVITSPVNQAHQKKYEAQYKSQTQSTSQTAILTKSKVPSSCASDVKRTVFTAYQIPLSNSFGLLSNIAVT